MKLIELALERVLIETHDDFDPWMLIIIGFDDHKNLVISKNVIYFRHSLDNYTKAVVNKDDAFEMAMRLNIKLTELPEYFINKFGTNHMASFDEIDRYFSDLLDFILHCGVHYKLVDSRK